MGVRDGWMDGKELRFAFVFAIEKSLCGHKVDVWCGVCGCSISRADRVDGVNLCVGLCKWLVLPERKDTNGI